MNPYDTLYQIILIVNQFSGEAIYNVALFITHPEAIRASGTRLQWLSSQGDSSALESGRK